FEHRMSLRIISLGHGREVSLHEPGDHFPIQRLDRRTRNQRQLNERAKSFDIHHRPGLDCAPILALSFATNASPTASADKGCCPVTSSRSSMTLLCQSATASTCAPASVNAFAI